MQYQAKDQTYQDYKYFIMLTKVYIADIIQISK